MPDVMYSWMRGHHFGMQYYNQNLISNNRTLLTPVEFSPLDPGF